MNFRSFVKCRGLRSAVVMLFLVESILCTSVRAEDAALTDIVVTNTMEHLLVYFRVTDCFTEDMNKAIKNGINTTFIFFIKVHKVKNFWMDSEIADLEVSHSIQYDNLKNEYNIRLSERGDEVITVKDFEKAKRLMSEVVDVKLCELKELEKGSRYKVEMMAELDKIRLPLLLHYVFFFLSLWDFETEWYMVDFRY